MKAKSVEDTGKATLQGEIDAGVAKNSSLYADDHRGYFGQSGLFCTHKNMKHSAKEFANGMDHINGIESFWAGVKKCYHNIYHHLSTKYLHRYINESSFWLNEGDCTNRSLEWFSSPLIQSVGRRNLYGS